MAPLLFTCPTTHRRAPTRIETDPNSLAAAWRKTLKVECPHCGEVHRISVREAYVKFAIQDGTDPIVVDRPPGVLPRPPKGFIPRKQPKNAHTPFKEERGTPVGLVRVRPADEDLLGPQGRREALASADAGAFPVAFSARRRPWTK